jgi:hypothetical protein
MSLFASRPAWQLPVRWPDGSAASDARLVVRERLLKAAILFAMLALTVLDRFGLGEKASVGMPAMYALAGAMVLGGVAELNFRAALAYLAIVSVATLSLLVNATFAPLALVSPASLLLLTVAYAPFCVSLRQGAVTPELWRWTVNLYIAFAVFVAVAGIVQFFVQFVYHPEWLFDYRPLIPESLRAPGGWNTDYTIGADGVPVKKTFASDDSPGGWTKSNGFFMREPSFFSVVMAFGLVCELSMARRIRVMSVLVLGLALSYSGSGLLCLAVALLFLPLGRETMVRVLAFAVLAAALFVLFGDALNLSYTLNRVNEFGSRGTSAYIRWVAPTEELVRQLDSNPWTSVLGNGPGSMGRIIAASFGQSAFVKAPFEYGLVGTLAFGVLILGALNRSAAPAPIRVVAGVGWLLIGGLADAMLLLFIYIVSAMWPEDTARTLRSGALGREAQRGVIGR